MPDAVARGFRLVDWRRQRPGVLTVPKVKRVGGGLKGCRCPTAAAGQGPSPRQSEAPWGDPWARGESGGLGRLCVRQPADRGIARFVVATCWRRPICSRAYARWVSRACFPGCQRDGNATGALAVVENAKWSPQKVGEGSDGQYDLAGRAIRGIVNAIVQRAGPPVCDVVSPAAQIQPRRANRHPLAH